MAAESLITEQGIGVHPKGLLVLPKNVADAISMFIPTQPIKDGSVHITHHTPDAVQLLRNKGYDVPSRLSLYSYGSSGRLPYEHQKVTIESIISNHTSAVLSGLGSGKTACAAWAEDLLKSMGEIDWAVVLAPLSTMHTTWANEFFTLFPEKAVTVAHHSNKAKRLKLMDSGAEVIILNHDAVSIGEVYDKLCEKEGNGFFIIDELTAYKNYSADRSKAMRNVLRTRKERYGRKDRVVGMTGLPCPNDSTDAFGQLKLLYPDKIKHGFKRFRDSMQRQITQFRWMDLPDADKRVAELFEPQVCFRTRDCIELPETIDHFRRVSLSQQQSKLFNQMAKNLTVQLKSEEITAVNEASKRTKLLQIVSGIMYTEDDKAEYIPCQSRIDEVCEVIDETEGKTIVFLPFRAAAERFEKELSKSYNTALVHGGVSTSKRVDIFSRFQTPNDKSVEVLVAQPAAMSHGVTLTEADTIVWVVPPSDGFETYHQANARIVRPGQKRVTNIVHIYATDIEYKIYERMKLRKTLTGLLSELFATSGSSKGKLSLKQTEA